MVRYSSFFIVALLVLMTSGCASVRSSEQTVDKGIKYVDNMTDAEKEKVRDNIASSLKNGISSYKLSPGDTVEVMYHISLTTEAQDYQLGVNDEVNVEFYNHPQLNRTIPIRPDGKITMPIKGDIQAAGIKPATLANNIRDAFSDILNGPIVTVTVNKYSSKINELQRAITNSTRGQAKICAVTPDGNIYLPLLQAVKAAGLTFDELRERINKEYSVEFNNLKVSVLVESVVGKRAFVFGEVQKPGVLQITHPITVMQAIAMAGGLMPTGSLENVKLLYWNDQNQAVVKTINLENVMEKVRIEEDSLVPGNSVIFVPMTSIAKADRFVDQYIRQLLLFQGSNISFTWALHGTSTTP